MLQNTKALTMNNFTFTIATVGSLVCLVICGCQPQSVDSTVVTSQTVTQSTETADSTFAQSRANESLGSAEEDSDVEANGDAAVEFVRAVAGSKGWTFYVTVAHQDTGWDDYADGWDVVLPDGTVVGAKAGARFTRLLAHPHEKEQPFTRSQSGLQIPEGVTVVKVRAHDIVDGFGGPEVIVDLSKAKGDRFSVE